MPDRQDDKRWARTEFSRALKSLFVADVLPNGKVRKYTAVQFANEYNAYHVSRSGHAIEVRSVQSWATGGALPDVIELVHEFTATKDRDAADRMKTAWEIAHGSRARPAAATEFPDLSLEWDHRPEPEAAFPEIELDLLRPYAGNEPGSLKINAKLFFKPFSVESDEHQDYLIGVFEPELRITSASHRVAHIIGDDHMPNENFRKSGNGKTIVKQRGARVPRAEGDPLKDAIVADMQPANEEIPGRIAIDLTVDQRNFVVTRRAADGTENIVLGNNENRKAIIGLVLKKAAKTAADGHIVLVRAEMRHKPRSDAGA